MSSEQSLERSSQVGVIFAALALAMALSSLDQTIVATALPTIVGELGGLQQLPWVVTAYLLTSTVSTPIYGKLGDLYGRKNIFLLSIAIFLLGSVLCGLAQNIGQLIAFRALQGIGGGGLMVGAQAIIADVVSPRERGRYSGYFGAIFGITSVAGPLLGGLIVDYTTWRWIFYVNLPVGLIALVVIALVLHLPVRRLSVRIDYLGTALLSIGVVCIVLLTTWGGNEYPWLSKEIIGLGVAGVVALIVFGLVERSAPEPIIPLSLFRNKVFAISSTMGFVVGLALFGAVTYLPQYQQIVTGASPTSSGLQLLPLMAGLLGTSIGSGQLISRYGRYKVFPIAGTILMTVGLLLLSQLTVNTPQELAWLYMFVLGAGLGLVMQVLVLAVQNAVDPAQLGTATSASTFFRSIGGSFGIAVFATIFNQQFAHKLAAALPPGPVTAQLISGSSHITPAILKTLPAVVRDGYINAFDSSLHTVFLAAIPFVVIAFVLAMVLPEVPLRSSAPPLEGVAENFGMVRTAAAEAQKETWARVRAAQTALDKLDEYAKRNRLPEEWAQRLYQLLGARIPYLTKWAHPHSVNKFSPQAWQLAADVLQVERQTVTATEDTSRPEEIPAVEHLHAETSIRREGAQAALARLEELAPKSGAPTEQIDLIRNLFQSRIEKMDKSIKAARSGKLSNSDHQPPEAFWRVAAELLAAERQILTEEVANKEVSDVGEEWVDECVADERQLLT